MTHSGLLDLCVLPSSAGTGGRIHRVATSRYLKVDAAGDIDHSFNLEQHANARILAMEMHELSQNSVLEMSSWMNAFFKELVTTSEASEEEAWDIGGVCLRKVFEVLRVPRPQLSNATMDGDVKSQCATYLWALIQSHKVMKEF